MYRFALRPEAEVFPFFQDMAGVSAEFAGGWVGGAFEFVLDGEFVAFNTTDINGDYQTNDYFAERSASSYDGNSRCRRRRYNAANLLGR